MKKNMFALAAAAALAVVCAGLARPVAAQACPPKKPVTLVVGFAAGGGADTAARLIARRLSENVGQTVVVYNRAGAGGNIAHAYVANAPADGSVILLGSIGPLSIAPHLMKLGYDPVRDLAPITMGLNFPNVLVVGTGLGVKTVAEYVALAKKKPGALDFASTGAGSASHLAGELFNQRAGVEIVHVPYKGGAPAMVDVLAGRVASYYAVPSTAAPPPPASRAHRRCRTCRRWPNPACRASTPPTGTRSSRPARPRCRSSTAGTGRSSRC
jgi:tripartite-type tricarboxylate transporter receptor subunit TctC